MLVFLDMELTSLHKGASPISLGMVNENGKEFYAEFWDFDRRDVSHWVSENIIPRLRYLEDIVLERRICVFDGQRDTKSVYDEEKRSQELSRAGLVEVVGDKYFVKMLVVEWLKQFEKPIQLVGDVAHYDMVLFLDLFGHAADLPQFISPCIHDINQDIARYLSVSDREAFDVDRIGFATKDDTDVSTRKALRDTTHNALLDAKVIRLCYLRCTEVLQC